MKKIFFLILILILTSCTRKPQIIDPIPEHNSFTIQSNILNETRVITVWTPPNYKENTDSLPVLYMPDGRIKEDFPHIANTIAKLIENKSIAPIILVGIENTVRGRDLSGVSEVKEDEKYCPLTDGASNFRSFITQELFNEINSNYRTTETKGIIGESLAGLFVMETFFLKPETFNFYIAMDPSIWWNNNYLEREASQYLSNFPNTDIKLWYGGSSVKDISTHTNKLSKTLRNSAPKNLTWKYSDEPNEEHSTIFRATKEKALIWILN